MRMFLYRLSFKVREHQFTVELVLWAILLAMIGYEIVLIRGEISAANEQMDLLKRSTEAAVRQADRLDSMLEQQKESINAIRRMNQILQKQLDIIAADQRRRLEELARKPQLHFQVGNKPLLGSPGESVPYKELGPTKTVLEVLFRNEGNAPARSGIVRVVAENPDVKLTCDCPFSEMKLLAGTRERGILVNFDWLPERGWTMLPLTVEYPEGSPEFRIRFNIEAENFARAPMGAIRIRPTGKGGSGVLRE